MANKITMDSVHAFIAGKPFRRENMEVTVNSGGAYFNSNGVYLRLHGNIIALRGEDGKVYIRNCGWETNTTKMRLNYLLYALNSPLKIVQKNWIWYLGNKQWDGGKTYVYDETYNLNTITN